MLNVSIRMEFNDAVQLRRVYQDTRNSSSIWRQRTRIFHPLTERQFANRFGQGDRVTMRIINPTNKKYINGTIVTILPYDTTQQCLGSYNIDSSFNDVPFTRVLVLEP